MSFKRGKKFVCVVVERAGLEVVGASDEPVLAGDKTGASYRDPCNFDRLY